MTPSLGMYNLNMYGNSWTGLLQQGMGMLGGGFGGFGSCGIFTNCFGEVNYDAMAGYGVANALLGVAGQAINSTVSQKREAKAEYQDNKAEIEKIDEQISDLNNLKPEEEIDAKYDKNITEAKNEQKTANDNLTAAKQKKSELEAKLATATEEEKKTINQQIEDLKIDDLQKKVDTYNGDKTVEGSVKWHEAQRDAAIEAKKAEIQRQIKELEEKKAKLEKAVNDIDLDKADGKKFQRTKKEDFDAKWKEDGSMADNVEFSKGDMRYAIAGFRNATSDEDKKYWANKIATIYKNMNQSDITSDFKAARKIVDSYVD